MRSGIGGICDIGTIAASALPLDEVAVAFGGKAAGLVRLQRSGFRTPPTWFVPPQVGLGIIDVTTLDLQVSRWAVRSSSANEDGEQRSYAGLFSSELAVVATAVPDAVARVRASGANSRLRAVYDLVDHGPIPVVLQPFLDAELAGVWIGDGAGGGVLEWSSAGTDAVVAGTVTPARELWRSEEPLGGNALRVAGREVGAGCLAVERAMGEACDLEFCVHAGQLVWLQCRPVTAFVPSGVAGQCNGEVVVSGIAAAAGISRGRPRVVLSHDDEAWAAGDILVVRYTSIEWVPLMTEASAVVTDIGGGLSHAAIISRELGIPCVTGTGTGTQALADMAWVTVDGDGGRVFR